MNTLNNMKIWSAVIGFAVFALLATVVISTGVVCCKTMSHGIMTEQPPVNQSPSELTVSYCPLEKAIDYNNGKPIVISREEAKKIDFIYQTTAETQKTIIKRQDDLINDIRQETNNNLDKMAMWLSFWISVIALIGTFLPIALSMITHHRDEKLRGKTKKDINILRHNINDTVRTKMQDLDQKQKTVEERMEKELKDFRLSVKAHTLEMSAYNLRNGIQSNLLHDLSDGKEIARRLMEQISQQLSEFLNHLNRNFLSAEGDEYAIVDNSAVIYLIGVLISINDALQSTALDTPHWRQRYVNQCRDMIHNLLSRISKQGIATRRDFLKLADLPALLLSLTR